MVQNLIDAIDIKNIQSGVVEFNENTQGNSNSQYLELCKLEEPENTFSDATIEVLCFVKQAPLTSRSMIGTCQMWTTCMCLMVQPPSISRSMLLGTGNSQMLVKNMGFMFGVAESFN